MQSDLQSNYILPFCPSACPDYLCQLESKKETRQLVTDVICLINQICKLQLEILHAILHAI